VETWASPYLAAHAAYLRYLGTAPGAEVRSANDLYAVRTGVASNTENGVLSGAGARVTVEHARDLVGWFGDAPASWLCAEGRGRKETARVLKEAGCRPETDAWEMHAALPELPSEPVSPSSGTSIVQVASANELRSWLDVAAANGWFEADAERQAVDELFRGLGLGQARPLCHYLALHEDAPVGLASAFYGEDVVLLATVAVVPEHRRAGIGRALALTRLREARRRGCTHAVLAPSPDGAKLYESIGFTSHREPSGRWFYFPDSDT
jgi:GNAT superfamily N-acetyltransferase